MGEDGQPRLVPIQSYSDDRGILSVLDAPSLPFACQRLYWISEPAVGAVRGNHGHHRLEQVILALQGKFTLEVWNKAQSAAFEMTCGGPGVYVPPGWFRRLSNFDTGTVALVAASLPYDPSDYFADGARSHAVYE